MRMIENECVDCGFPCIESACRYYAVTRYYCDECGNEDVLYEFEDRELCLDCIKEQLVVVDGSDI